MPNNEKSPNLSTDNLRPAFTSYLHRKIDRSDNSED
jgi:hypothetical protein